MTNALESHRVLHRDFAHDFQNGPHLFDLNRGGPGISIPDQMSRGYHAVLEALENGYIGPDKPLLVIGAGVAGLMAAMTAVEENVKTLVVEKKGLLTTQGTCQSRYVCPTQYAWPDADWRRGFYPYNGEPMPFTWVRGLVADVVNRTILSEVNKFLADHNESLIVLASEFLDYHLDSLNRRWVVPELSAEPATNDVPDAFAMALACAGFGTENTTAAPFKKCPPLTSDSTTKGVAATQPPYTGFKFWETDEYEEDVPHMGLESKNLAKVVISGSGDGALQDFLRIVIRGGSLVQDSKSAGALYDAIERSLKPRVRKKLEMELGGVQHKYQGGMKRNFRIRDLRIKKQANCAANAEAHAAYQDVVEELAGERDWEQITKTLDEVLKNLQTEVTVKMIYPCSHLTPFYGLNRFLVMLIGKYVEQKYPGIQIFHSRTMVTNIVSNQAGSSAAHACGDADLCHGEDHQVFWTAAANCVDVPPSCITDEHEFAGGPYNVVIVRHGIRGRKDLLGRP